MGSAEGMTELTNIRLYIFKKGLESALRDVIYSTQSRFFILSKKCIWHFSNLYFL